MGDKKKESVKNRKSLNVLAAEGAQGASDGAGSGCRLSAGSKMLHCCLPDARPSLPSEQ